MGVLMKYVTKENIIEALKTEPLRRGDFFHNFLDYQNNPSDLETCPVCAVGAVLRQCLAVTSSIAGHSVTKGNALLDPNSKLKLRNVVRRELENKNYLGALSIYFEGQNYSDSFVTPNEKRNLIRFVQRNFPKRIGVNL